MKYEVTLTLLPRWHVQTTEKLYVLIRTALHGIHQKWRSTFVVELHASGVPHVHGLVDLADLRARARYLDDLRGLKQGNHAIFGRLEVAQVKYEQSYREYMVKDIPRTKYQMGLDPLLSNYHDITSALTSSATGREEHAPTASAKPEKE